MSVRAGGERGETGCASTKPGRSARECVSPRGRPGPRLCGGGPSPPIPPPARPVLGFSPSFSLGCPALALPVDGFRYLGIFFFFLESAGRRSAPGI